MKNFDLGQTISILANIGVIAGIVFLGYELRQNNRLLQSEASIAYVEMRTSGLDAWASDRDTLTAMLQAWDGEELGRVEALSLDFNYWSVFVNWEWEYGQYREGILQVLDQPPESRWRAVVDYYPLMRDSWAKHKNSLSPEFVQYMEDAVLSE